MNGFALKLEGHFQYKSAPALVEPHALSPAQFQELTDYGLRHHVQLIPYLDAPGHIAFILKHPEYAGLREYPESNYELCATNPDSYKLLFGMFQDLLDANKGVKYFYLSTDEPYYIGMADNAQCQEAVRAKELGSVGKLLAEFTTKTANYLHDRGRTVVFWGESPLKPDDLAALPAHIVNGETYGPQFDPLFRKHGIRQMIYSSSEGRREVVSGVFPAARFAAPAPGPPREPPRCRHISEDQLSIPRGSMPTSWVRLTRAGPTWACTPRPSGWATPLRRRPHGTPARPIRPRAWRPSILSFTGIASRRWIACTSS